MGKGSVKSVSVSNTIKSLVNKINKHKATEDEKNTFYGLIVNLVRKQSYKYQKTIKDVDFEDLVNIGFLHIIKNLYNYNDEYAFTTWASYCLKSAYIREYNLYKKRKGINLGNDLISGDCSFSCQSDFSEFVVFDEISCLDKIFIRDTIRDLFNHVGTIKLNVKILKEMFGNPFIDDYSVPVSISVGDVANKLKIDYSKVNVFWAYKIKPYLRNKFKELVNEQGF